LNGLRGSIPSTIAQDWPKIETLDLGNGQLIGKIPTSICECRHLLAIKLYNNQISGPIPSCIGNLPLIQLNFSRNNLTGTIPELATNVNYLFQTFDISHNSFHGALPTSLNNLVYIHNFIINDNNFTSVSGVEKFFNSVLMLVLAQWTIILGDVLFPAMSCHPATPLVNHTEIF